MNNTKKIFIDKTKSESISLLGKLGNLQQLDILWAGVPDYQHQITQADIDSVPAFMEAGLTAQQLADAQYAMAQIKTNISNAIVALTILASLS